VFAKGGYRRLGKSFLSGAQGRHFGLVQAILNGAGVGDAKWPEA
jgi:hypothetical protein